MSQKFDAISMMAWCGRVVLIYSPEGRVKKPPTAEPHWKERSATAWSRVFQKIASRPELLPFHASHYIAYYGVKTF